MRLFVKVLDYRVSYRWLVSFDGQSQIPLSTWNFRPVEFNWCTTCHIVKYFTSLILVLNSNFRIFFDHLLKSFPEVVMNQNVRQFFEQPFFSFWGNASTGMEINLPPSPPFGQWQVATVILFTIYRILYLMVYIHVSIFREGEKARKIFL